MYAVDGGLLANYPWQQIAAQIKDDHGHVDLKQFIGAKIEDHSMLMALDEGKALPLRPIHGFWSMTKAVADVIFYNQHRTFLEHPREIKNTAIVESDLSSTDFDLTEKQLKTLIDSGKQAALCELAKAYKHYLTQQQ